MTAAPEIELWSVDLPLPVPVATVIGPIAEMAVLAVRARDEGGNDGCGYASFPTRQQRDGAIAAVRAIGAHGEVRRDLRAAEAIDLDLDHAPDVWCGAASALSMTGWDLAARRQEVPCAQLWSDPPLPRPPCYGSGMFLGSSEAQLIAEARHFRALGHQAVKMRVGGDPIEDAERVAVVQSVFDEPGTVAVDAYEAWSSEQANRFVAALRQPLLWFEDPTPVAEMHEVRRDGAPLATGERCGSPGEVATLAEHLGPGVILVLDVQNLGGPARFLAAADAARARGAVVGAHVFSTVSLHLLAARSPANPVELLDWWDQLFDRTLTPDPDGRITALGPGFGVDLRVDALQAWGQRCSW